MKKPAATAAEWAPAAAMIRNNWNQRAGETGSTRLHLPSRPWYRFAIDLLRRRLPGATDGGRVLDVGCGTGEFLVLLRELGFEAEGVEGNREQSQQVRSLGFPVQTADMEEGLPYPDRVFPLVTCLELIEHIALAEALLEEIHRVLKPGGHLLLTTPNFSFLNNRFHYLCGKGPLNEGIHLRYFHRDRLLSLLGKAGFEVVAKNSYGPIPLWSSLAIRILHRECPLWRVLGWLEGLLAYDFIYLAVKR
jgi:SAM-dependent methyltransferase